MAHARAAARRRQRLKAVERRPLPQGAGRRCAGLPFRIGQSVVHAKFGQASSSMPRQRTDARCRSISPAGHEVAAAGVRQAAGSVVTHRRSSREQSVEVRSRARRGDFVGGGAGPGIRAGRGRQERWNAGVPAAGRPVRQGRRLVPTPERWSSACCGWRTSPPRLRHRSRLGDGRTVIMAAQKFGATALGIEYNPTWSRSR